VAQCDVITLHVHHEHQTEKMISRQLFKQFKPGSYFINTSRGELVDEQALLAALERKQLAGAAIDVLSDEFKPEFQQGVADQPLVIYARTHDNLIITPHIGGSTEDAWRLTQQHTIEKVVEALAAR
jgi:D-3-phosphoglycerate dehydrogenase